jgi:chemotaxis protein histidine kinase CheA
VQADLGPDAPQWIGPGGELLVLHDDRAWPALDLPTRWHAANATPAPGSAVLMLRASPDASPFGLQVDAIGSQHALVFWPLPPALQALCGVQAAALTGVPWQPESEQPVLLLDLNWLQAGVGG